MPFSGTLTPIRFLQSAETNGLSRDDCWTWTGRKNSNGYGRFVQDNKHRLAHRVSYELFVGDIPDGMNVCHACDNRLCVNPHHLWIGTQSENLKDAFAKGRHSPPDTNGEANGNRKLNAADVAKIRSMHKGGQKQYVLAKLFNVTPSTIRDVVIFKTWKDEAA